MRPTQYEPQWDVRRPGTGPHGVGSPVRPRAEVDGAIDRLIAEGGVDYVHVRSTSAGCFPCRLDRTPA